MIKKEILKKKLTIELTNKMDLFNFVPKILFIQGVFKHSVKNVEEIINPINNINNSNQQNDNKKTQQDFYTIDSSDFLEPHSCIKCAACSLQLDPTKFQIFIPSSMEKQNGNMPGPRFRKLGHVRFHRWGCAAYYIEHMLKNDSRYKQLLKKLFILHTKYTSPCIEIVPVTPPTNMKEFGGPQTRAEWELINDDLFNRFNTSFVKESILPS
jgi:hypothetical protein